jgi:NADH:ubiquinone oxidoreductase subunit F (NADH-binding)
VTYQGVKPDNAIRIVQEHLIEGKPVTEWLIDDSYYSFHSKQHKILLKDCGTIDPEDIQAYVNAGGYEAIKKILTEMTPEAVISEIKASGIRGRGGAGFPTGVKWEACRNAPGDPKYIVCNADEGDPGAFMDRSIIEGNPHAVIEGMMIAAYAIGSDLGYVYIRAEYPAAVERLKLAISQAHETGCLGNNLFGSDFNFDLRV